MFGLALTVGLLCAVQNAAAHMAMSNPIPFRSKLLGISANTDYSITAPLAAIGLDGLCKGYLSDFDSTEVTGKLVAGSTMQVDIEGGASHNGGSCEFSVSYDQKTFVVIHRIVGGCPLSPSYSFQVPDDLPGASKAVFSWSWINYSGNREFYQNCAPVEIEGTSSSYTGPEMYVANMFADGSCTNEQNTDVQYPNINAVSTDYEGSSVDENSPVTELSSCNIEQSKMVTVQGDGSAPQEANSFAKQTGKLGKSGKAKGLAFRPPPPKAAPPKAAPPAAAKPAPPPAPPAKAPAPAPTTSSVVVTPSSSSSSSSTSTSEATTSSSSSSEAVPTSSESASSEAVPTSSDSASSESVSTSETSSMPEEPTTTSSAEEAEKTPAKLVFGTPPMEEASEGDGCISGAIQCKTRSTWSMCSNSAWIDMGITAAGMACVDGQMVLDTEYGKAQSGSNENSTSLEADLTARSCVGGTFLCTSAKTWSMCSNDVWIDMGSTAGGMSCVDGQMMEDGAVTRRVRRIRRHHYGMKRLSH